MRLRLSVMFSFSNTSVEASFDVLRVSNCLAVEFGSNAGWSGSKNSVKGASDDSMHYRQFHDNMVSR